MTLTQAKEIADNPGAFSDQACIEALAYLQQPRVVSRMRNVTNDRALDRYAQRLERLENEIEAIRNS